MSNTDGMSGLDIALDCRSVLGEGPALNAAESVLAVPSESGLVLVAVGAGFGTVDWRAGTHDQPHAGSLFCVAPEAQGLPANAYAG